MLSGQMQFVDNGLYDLVLLQAIVEDTSGVKSM